MADLIALPVDGGDSGLYFASAEQRFIEGNGEKLPPNSAVRGWLD
jgi:hypothetical protein